MAQATFHTRWGGKGTEASVTTQHSRARADTAPTRTHAPRSTDPAELAAGCAIAAGFRDLHRQLIGLPTTLRALLALAERRKLASIVPAAAASQVATLTHKLHLVPPLLQEWQAPQSLASAQLLCTQARQLLEEIPVTRQFLRARYQAFQEAVRAGTTELPAALLEVTLAALRTADTQIRVQSNHLVTSHMGMVHLLAREYRHGGVSEDDVRDLMQAGCEALLRAAQWFDVRAGARFRTYATFWLRHAMTHALRSRRIVVPPRAQQRIARQLTRTAQQLEQLFTRPLSPEELAAATGLLPREMATALATQLREVSLDAPFGDGLTLADVLVAPASPLEMHDPDGSATATPALRARHGPRRR